MLLEVACDLFTRCVERLLRRRLDRVQLDDVPAEFRLHEAARFTLFQRIDRVFNRLDEQALLDHAQITASLGRTRVLRIGLGNRGEIGRSRAHLRQHGFRFRLGRSLVGWLCILGHRDQDMAGAALLGRRVVLEVLVKEVADFGVRHLHLIFDGGSVKDDVFGLDLLGNLEQRCILVVVRLDHRIGNLDLWQIGRDREHDLLHFTLLIVDVRQARCDAAWCECRGLDRTGQLLHGEIAAQALVEHRRRHALRCQSGLVAFHVEATVRLAELLDLHDGLLQRCIADVHVRAGDLGADGAFADQIVENRFLRFGRFEHLLIELGAHHLACLVDLATLRIFPLLARDLFAANGGDVGAGIVALVTLQTDKHERWDDQKKQDPVHPTLVVPNKFKHGQPFKVENAITAQVKKKGELAFASSSGIAP